LRFCTDNARGRQIKGHVRRLPYPYGSGGGTVGLEEEDRSTRISIDEAGVELEPGQLARVTIVLEQVADVLWLPPAAIRAFEGRKFVVIQDGARQRRVDVTVGIESEERVEIKAGLEEGQVVIGP
jgi:hypothetical protein